MVEALIAATNTTLDQFHLIGFSLGAHVSGHAGKKLKLKRISGEAAEKRNQPVGKALGGGGAGTCPPPLIA